MGAADVAMYAGVVVSVGAALEVIRRMARNLYRAWRATRAGFEHLAEVREVVVRELMPNGGGSMLDRVARIDARVARLEEAQESSDAASNS